MGRRIAIVGVPTSAGAFAPGQELAPAALREAGLVEKLEAAGAAVDDRGDRAVWRWRPDREQPRAQHAALVGEIARETAGRVAAAGGDAEVVLVLGGDCTVGVGTVSGQLEAALTDFEESDGLGSVERVGLLYFDAHADLNTPDSVHEGALDWMGIAHLLGEEGVRAELAEIGPVTPLLAPDQVLVLGWGPEQATAHERAAIERLGLEVVEGAALAADPEGTAAAALASLEASCDRIVVHFDVDVVDFAETPLSENPGRNEGVPFEAALRALAVLLAAPRLAALTVTELNPAHAEEGGGAIERLAAALAAGLAGR